MNKIKWTIAALLFVVSVTGFAGCSSNPVEGIVETVKENTVGENAGSGNMTLVSEREFDGSEFEEISIKTNTAGVTVQPSPDNKATVKLMVDESIKNEIEFSASVKSGMLTVKAEEKENHKVTINQSLGQRLLVIELPAQAYKRFIYTSDIGSFVMKDLQSKKINLTTEIGAVSLEKVEGAIDIHTSTGTVDVTVDQITEDMDIETEIGTVNIYTEKDPTDVRVALQSEMGKVEADVPGMDYTVHSNTEAKGSIGNGKTSVAVRTGIGKIGMYVK